MTDLESNIRPTSTRRRIAVAVAVIGAVIVANHLANVWPRDVIVSYQVGPEVTALDVDYLDGEEAVASVRFRSKKGESGDFRHSVRLHPGAYRVHATLHEQDGSASEEDRALSAPTAGVVRIDLRDLGAAE